MSTFDPATLTLSPIGQLICPAQGQPMSMTVAASGHAYVAYTDGKIYRVDLATLDCSGTSFTPGQLSLSLLSIALAANGNDERLFVYGERAGSPVLARSDLVTFTLTEIGSVTPPPVERAQVMQGDADGRLFAMSMNGLLSAIDPSSGAVTRRTGAIFRLAPWALLLYRGQTFYFGYHYGSGPPGYALRTRVFRYEADTQTLSSLFFIDDPIVAASAAPCIP